ncbi:enoyl-CoA hydratase/isomerase family protein [Bacillus sp. H-16]|uniref:enoyl-CoA hydratase-related protein n=1 Tax=Alteribacter salitolerans TaxID=2912333 RepID=UPI001963CD39|nr:enoyl-CoA hydratase-related protein [Alteribacter salitolerans]MBM7095951.1 enoyl-CoA hydratase/isomerase family protein [Alteribacter salitolerans]
MSLKETIRHWTEGPVGVIQLYRPDVYNALNRKMVDEVVEQLFVYDRDDTIRVIVLTGSDRAFAAGADIEEMANDDAVSLELLNQFAQWDRMAYVKKPVIGAVSGFVFGGGFELALNCDLLFASETVDFRFPEVNLAVMPGAGGTQRLTKAMGKTKALEYLWTGDTIPAKEALACGLVNRLIAPELVMEETMKFAKRLAEQPPLAVRLIKEAANKAVDQPLQEGMELERKNFYLLFSSLDQKEGMQAFLEKRKPRFTGK